MAGHDIIEKAQTLWLYTLVSFPCLCSLDLSCYCSPQEYWSLASTSEKFSISYCHDRYSMAIIHAHLFVKTLILRDLLLELFKFIEIDNFFSGNSWKEVFVETSKLYSGLFKVLFLVRELKNMRLFPPSLSTCCLPSGVQDGSETRKGGNCQPRLRALPPPWTTGSCYCWGFQSFPAGRWPHSNCWFVWVPLLTM